MILSICRVWKLLLNTGVLRVEDPPGATPQHWMSPGNTQQLKHTKQRQAAPAPTTTTLWCCPGCT